MERSFKQEDTYCFPVYCQNNLALYSKTQNRSRIPQNKVGTTNLWGRNRNNQCLISGADNDDDDDDDDFFSDIHLVDAIANQDEFVLTPVYLNYF